MKDTRLHQLLAEITFTIHAVGQHETELRELLNENISDNDRARLGTAASRIAGAATQLKQAQTLINNATEPPQCQNYSCLGTQCGEPNGHDGLHIYRAHDGHEWDENADRAMGDQIAAGMDGRRD